MACRDIKYGKRNSSPGNEKTARAAVPFISCIIFIYFTDQNGKTWQALNDDTHYMGAELEQHTLTDADGNSVTVTQTTNGNYYFRDDNGTGFTDNGDGTWSDENGNNYTEN